MASYILRNIDLELWREVKARADRDGHALRFVILALLREYVTHGLRRPGGAPSASSSSSPRSSP